MINYSIIFLVLWLLEVVYFKIADHYNIIDKPNERSSHSTIVLRGGGILFPLAALVWIGSTALTHEEQDVASYLPFLSGMLLVAGVSFVDDIRSLPDRLRLIVQFVAYGLMFWSLGVGDLFDQYGWLIGIIVMLISLIVCVGATNIYNFMDGINGITAAYSFSVLVPLLLINERNEYVPSSLLLIMTMAVLVFGFFNFRQKGKAKCFAGDVGSISMAYVLLFALGSIIYQTKDVTWLIFLAVYGVDGVLTICHRIMLHENLGEAHRKHAFQLMANELKMNHLTVSSLYAVIQLVISLGFIYLCPATVLAHWCYLLGTLIFLCVAYILFKKKYYHLHEVYLASLKS